MLLVSALSRRRKRTLFLSEYSKVKIIMSTSMQRCISYVSINVVSFFFNFWHPFDFSLKYFSLQGRQALHDCTDCKEVILVVRLALRTYTMSPLASASCSPRVRRIAPTTFFLSLTTKPLVGLEAKLLPWISGCAEPDTTKLVHRHVSWLWDFA